MLCLTKTATGLRKSLPPLLCFLPIAFVGAVMLVGCSKPAEEPAESAASEDHEHSEEHGHTHEGGDVLFWQREDIEDEGYTINLGHHGLHVYEGHEVEPAVGITQGDQDVADAQVFVSLLDAESEKELQPEVPTVYEPKSDEEPAHYAQGQLAVPLDAERVVLRYRIVLPGGAGEKTYDVPVDVEAH